MATLITDASKYAWGAALHGSQLIQNATATMCTALNPLKRPRNENQHGETRVTKQPRTVGTLSPRCENLKHQVGKGFYNQSKGPLLARGMLTEGYQSTGSTIREF